MLHTYLPDNTIKLRFTSIFDDASVPVITHDFNAKTLRLGPGYSILDENGDPLGAGGGGGITGTISANQIAFGAGADTIGGSAGLTFEADNYFDVKGSTGPEMYINLLPDISGDNFIFVSAPPANDDYPTVLKISGNPLTADMGSTYAGIVGLDVSLGGAAAVADVQGVALSITGASNVSGSVTRGIIVTALIGNGATDTSAELFGIDIFQTQDLSTNAALAAGLRIGDVSGATDNYAIKTGAGDIVFGTLAGSGTRYVYVDDDGKLVAGAAV